MKTDNISLKVEAEPANTMALDPNILIGIASVSIVPIITGLFAVWQNFQDNKSKKLEYETTIANAIIKIKMGDLEVEVPQGISQERFEEIMKMIEPYKIKSIALITEP